MVWNYDAGAGKWRFTGVSAKARYRSSVDRSGRFARNRGSAQSQITRIRSGCRAYCARKREHG